MHSERRQPMSPTPNKVALCRVTSEPPAGGDQMPATSEMKSRIGGLVTSA